MRLIDSVNQVLIVAYREDTRLLEAAIAQAGFSYRLLRQNHQPEFASFSPSYRCLLNHRSAWEQVIQTNVLTLIVEADFVPVAEFAEVPTPFNLKQANVGIAWLYTCAPQLYSISPDGYAEGYSTSMVAYLLTPNGAQELLAFADPLIASANPTQYLTWDSDIDKFFRSRGYKNYIPFRNYGEHGGIPNREHQQHGYSSSHRADVLYGQLAFLPLYATHTKHPHLYLMGTRLNARCKGLARLMVGKFLRWKVATRSSSSWRLIKFSIRRHLTLTL